MAPRRGARRPKTYDELCEGLPNHSLFVLGKGNPMRKAMIKVVKSQTFDQFILLLILANCVFLAMDTKEVLFEESAWGKATAMSEHIFTGIYVVEMCMKIIAMGFFYGKGSYLSDPWNRMDFFVVVLGLLGYLPGMGNYSGIRTVRILRPLRTITGVKGMRQLVVTLLRSLPMLFDVLILVFFAFFIFGIIGVQLFMSKTSQRCAILGNPAAGCESCGLQDDAGYTGCDTSCVIPAAPTWVYQGGEDGDVLCSGPRWNSYPDRGDAGAGNACPAGQYCVQQRKQDLPNFGFSNFDNIAWAWLTIFQCISMEGWTNIMYMVMDTTSTWTWPYFVVLIVFGSFFAVNLALAVLYVYFTGAGEEGRDDDEEKELPIPTQEGEVAVTHRNALQKMCFKIASSQRFEQVTIGLIILNTAVMASDHNRMPRMQEQANEYVNYFLFAYFVVEMIIKLIGFGPRGYAKDQMNLFDGFVVLMSCVEVVVGFISSDNGNNYLSVLRTFRLLRVFKLARSWKQLNDIITTMFKSLAGISYLSLILLLFMYVFALLGMQLFGYEFIDCGGYGIEAANKNCPAGMTKECPDHFDCYAPCESSQVGQWVTFVGAEGGLGGECVKYGGAKWNPNKRTEEAVSEEYLVWLGRSEYARHSFDNIFWAFITIFQILTGENWNEVMYDGMRHTNSWTCVYFIVLVVLGNYIILNLFLAILLDNFGGVGEDDDGEGEESVRGKKGSRPSSRAKSLKDGGAGAPSAIPSIKDEKGNKLKSYNSMAAWKTEDFVSKKSNLEKLKEQGVDPKHILYGKHVPALKHSSLYIFGPHNPLRLAIAKVIYHKYFEYFIIGVILISSIILAVDGPAYSKDAPVYDKDLPNLQDKLKTVMDIMDTVFLFFFVFEAMLKVIVRGFIAHEGAYLRSAWNVLDFIIVIVGLIAFGIEYSDGSSRDLMAVRALRTFRALRPLRMASRAQGMKVVVNALFSAVPGITNVAFVCLLFYVIFGILGLNLFMGKMYYCGDASNIAAHLVPESVGVLDAAMTRAWCFRDDGAHFHYCPAKTDPLYASRNEWTSVLDLPRASGDAWTCSKTTAGTGFTAAWDVEVSGTIGAEWTCTPGADTVTAYASGAEFTALAAANGAGDYTIKSTCEPKAYQTAWVNPRDYDFDNIGHSMLSLFEMATLEGWLEIMYHGADTTEIDLQPIRDNNPYYCLFFAFFIIVGSFFVMNLFVGVTIDKFNEMKEKQEKSVFLTDEQQSWVTIQRLLVGIRLKKTANRPLNRMRNFIYDIVTSRRFESLILTLIMVNIVVMSMTHADMSEDFEQGLFLVNCGFAAIFCVEAIMKLIAFKPGGYFRDPWNTFDFFVVTLSVVGIAVTLTTDISATYLSIIRVFRVARIFRLIPKAKGLKKLFQTLLYSLPALTNVGAVLFLFFFIFAVLGMNLFGKVRITGNFLNRYANFETFGFSMLTLFRMATGEAWNGIMHDCMITKDCVYYQDPATGDVTYYNQEDSFWQDLDEDTYTNQCTPHPVGAIIFFCFFCILCAFVMLNLVIAVILDNFQNNSKTSELGVSKEDMMHFTDVWMRLDPRATYYIPAEKLPRVIGAMDHPVGTRGLSKREAKTKCMHVIMTVDIPNHDGKIHFLETLHALTGRIAGTELPESEEVKVRDSMVDRLPTFDNAKDVPKFTAAHFHAALYVQAAVRGYMQRYRMREKLKQAETRAEEKREAAEARKAGK
mmetsp:Transcript_10457/g.29239  ORF Transcript_10457/g.29239 Transcript_10457/m.29239 type:complete len:1711 (-) Transcript_10457:60-5192(-)